MLHGLKSANFCLVTPNTKHRLWKEDFAIHYRLNTLWSLQVKIFSTYKPIEIYFITQETPASELNSFTENTRHPSSLTKTHNVQSERPKLGHVHPTFHIHEELMKSITGAEVQYGEATALDAAKLAFELADKQYGDKRLESSSISIRSVRSNREDRIESCTARLSRTQYEQGQTSMLNRTSQPMRHRVYLALGSNLGDRVSLIESACREMTHRGLRVVRTSGLYETKAMYLEDQQRFINGTCEVYTRNI